VIYSKVWCLWWPRDRSLFELSCRGLNGISVSLPPGVTVRAAPPFTTHCEATSSCPKVLSKQAHGMILGLMKYEAAMQGVDYVAVDKAGERLLSYSYNPAQLRRIAVPARALQACSCMEITTDLRDACIYILHRTVVQRIKLSSMSSIKVIALDRSESFFLHACNQARCLWGYPHERHACSRHRVTI
jgi:hypothetical protein